MLERGKRNCRMHMLNRMTSSTYTVFLLSLPFLLRMAHASSNVEMQQLSTNSSLFMTGNVKPSQMAFFQLDLSLCHEDQVLNVEAKDVEREDELLGLNVKGKSTILLMLNTLGRKPKATSLRSGLCLLNNGTTADCAEYKLARPYQLLHANISTKLPDVPWIVGLLNDNSWANVSLTYSVRAWCSATPSCPRDCMEVGICSGEGVCLCEPGRDGRGCGAIAKVLPTRTTVQRTLEPGGWDYFTCELLENQTILVEMWRQSGDPIIFAKRREEGFIPFGVPNVFDFSLHAAARSYRERLDYHHMFLTGGTNSATIGIYNSDAEFSEKATYNITVRSAPNDRLNLLCPRNCSYPQGKCNTQGACVCSPGFAGRFCEGVSIVATLSVPVTRSLSPGTWIFVEYDVDERYASVMIGFKQKGGQSTIVASEEDPPTLSNNSYRFTSPPSNRSLSILVSLKLIENLQRKYVFGIYNMNYYVHSLSEISLTFSLDKGGGVAISPLLASLMAVVGSLFFCLCFGVYRALYLQHLANSDQGDTENDLKLGKGIDEAVISSFPLVAYEKDSLTPQDESRCVICLVDYENGEMLRKLPKCSHLFHVECIATWLHSHHTCPICRVSLIRRIRKTISDSSSQQSAIRNPPISATTHPIATADDSVLGAGSEQEGRGKVVKEIPLQEVVLSIGEPSLNKEKTGSENTENEPICGSASGDVTSSLSIHVRDVECSASEERREGGVELVTRFQAPESKILEGGKEEEAGWSMSSLPSDGHDSLGTQTRPEK